MTLQEEHRELCEFFLVELPQHGRVADISVATDQVAGVKNVACQLRLIGADEAEHLFLISSRCEQRWRVCHYPLEQRLRDQIRQVLGLP